MTCRQHPLRGLPRRPKHLSFLLGILVLLASLLSPDRQAAAQGIDSPTLPPVRNSDPFFGVVQAIHDPHHATNAGVRWERLVAWWSNWQPAGPSDWNEDAWFPRNLMEDQKNRGVEAVGVVLHTPGWAARDVAFGPVSPPKNLDLPFNHPENYWGAFLTRLAAEYAGLVDTWILGNEPDIYRETYANWAGTVEEFAVMQSVGYRAIKAANPQARVLLAGTTYWWDVENDRSQYLDRLIVALQALPGAAENSFFFDAVSVHQYSNPLNSFAVPVVYRRILAARGLEKPLWLNESNVPPFDDPLRPLHRGGLRASLAEQANYVIQSVALARAAGVERYAIYKMRDEQPENDQYYGLVRNDGTPRPAYTAYQVSVRELSGVTDATYFWNGSATPPTDDEVTALLAGPTRGPQFVWPGALNGVRMTRGADRVTVLWNASAAPLPVLIPSVSPGAIVVDKWGSRLQLQRGPDRAFRLILAAATNNTDARDESLILVGGDPLIVVEPGAAAALDPLPRPIDACTDVPGALIPPGPSPAEVWVAPTGYAVSGPWLEFYRAHGDLDYIGFPRSPVVADPLDPEQCVQFFQRLVLEWHPNNPPEYRIQRRLLAVELDREEAAPAAAPARTNSADYWYFPKGDRGLGHAISNIAPDGAWIGFKSYFDRHGKEDAFGYPMAPPVRIVGPDGATRWTQRLQAAVFEYHAEFDIPGVKPGSAGQSGIDLPWRTWTVQLHLLGDAYLQARALPFISGDPAAHLPVPPRPTP
jgi:hypothetical protein